MTTKEVKGFTREEAFAATGIDADFSKFKNATIAWKKKGAFTNPKELNKFAAEYLAKQKAIGAFIVMESSSADTRERPYKVINEVTNGKRKQKRFYQVVEAELQTKVVTVTDSETGETKEVTQVTGVVSEGAVEAKSDKKDIAIKLVKELIEQNKKDYVIKIVSEVVEGQPYAAYGLYTPSKSAKLGSFVFFYAD